MRFATVVFVVFQTECLICAYLDKHTDLHTTICVCLSQCVYPQKSVRIHVSVFPNIVYSPIKCAYSRELCPNNPQITHICTSLCRQMSGAGFQEFLELCGLTNEAYTNLSLTDRLEIVAAFKANPPDPPAPNPAVPALEVEANTFDDSIELPPLPPATDTVLPVRTAQEEYDLLIAHPFFQGLGAQIASPKFTRLRMQFPSRQFEGKFLESLSEMERLCLRRIYHHSTARSIGERPMTTDELFTMVLNPATLRAYNDFIHQSHESEVDGLSPQTLRSSLKPICVSRSACVRGCILKPPEQHHKPSAAAS